MMLTRILQSAPPEMKRRILLVVGGLVLFNLVAWLCAFAAFHGNTVLLGTALLAYSFGLRHAVDADHIASVDNITRKLMQEGKRPISVGLYFSLGHATTVVLMTLVVALTAHALQGAAFEAWRAVGGMASTLISAFFLFTLAAANWFILINTWRSFKKARSGALLEPHDLDMLLSGGGLMARLFRRLFRLIERDWHIYLLGLLFGLGFDTATEVSLLAMSATGVAGGVSPWAIMVLPALFCAGMALVDTMDGILMLGAYGWAFDKPIRKLYYNLTITALSIAVALLIGGIETLGLMQDKLGLAGGFWDAVASLNDNFNLLGFGIIGLFVAGWVLSMSLYKRRGYDEA